MKIIEVDKENYFSAAEGLYWFCSENYSGMGDIRYNILSRLDFNPGMGSSSDDMEGESQYVYNSLMEIDARSQFECNEACEELLKDIEHVLEETHKTSRITRRLDIIANEIQGRGSMRIAYLIDRISNTLEELQNKTAEMHEIENYVAREVSLWIDSEEGIRNHVNRLYETSANVINFSRKLEQFIFNEVSQDGLTPEEQPLSECDWKELAINIWKNKEEQLDKTAEVKR